MQTNTHNHPDAILLFNPTIWPHKTYATNNACSLVE
ncbi:unnamed protein product [Acanthoscelides obtectus]|uniref:Uncharacterized protein n=1 Tax=Acanthoscelides obtectus TaxID=200917 RepID=A0A9P0LYJ6_ACAOB|nr:unnamed protein product [Acanthoscelides obtectus]CAK1629421.1 hypothetical protein AOBTE_LOCUS5733 [Acanthoscelides obtectus]